MVTWLRRPVHVTWQPVQEEHGAHGVVDLCLLDVYARFCTAAQPCVKLLASLPWVEGTYFASSSCR